MNFPDVNIGAAFDVISGATPSTGEGAYWNGDIPWITPADLGCVEGREISRGNRNITLFGYDSCGTQMVPANSIILSIRAPIGHIAITKNKLCFNQGCRGLVPRPIIDVDFAYYALVARRPQLEATGQGTTFIELSRDKLRSVQIPIPNLPTQKRIADFLDRETAVINGLVEKKQQLAGLLEEKRCAVITTAITRGFDPNVPMKSTGIDWLEEIPSHWKVCPLKHLIWYQEGPGIMARDFVENGVPLLRIRNLVGPVVHLNGSNYLDEAKVEKRWSHFRVEEGDLLISASATTGGMVSQVPKKVVGAVPYTGIIRIKARNKGYVKQFARVFLESKLFGVQTDVLRAGSTIQHFGPTHLDQMKAPRPPKGEQLYIADRLNTLLLPFETIIQKITINQQRLLELRSALITAAVTGQIDVDTWRRRGHTERQLDAIGEEIQA